MNSLHVVTLVPAARESISLSRSVTVRVFAQERVQSVVVESMGLSLVAEETSIGRKSGVLAFSFVGKLAPVGPQMGIQIFAVGEGSIRGHSDRAT